MRAPSSGCAPKKSSSSIASSRFRTRRASGRRSAFQSPLRSSALFSAFRPFASKSRSMRRRRSPACFPAACTRRISAAKSVKQASSRYTSATALCFSTSASCASVSTVTATGSAQSRAATPAAVHATDVCFICARSPARRFSPGALSPPRFGAALRSVLAWSFLRPVSVGFSLRPADAEACFRLSI